ncbi:unnamed protein product [Mytilus coruscus]|uniref:Uncharacterized protein n=1 Tax=Mytilus coruscus TaxID=42192 RepID=A0A6J8EVY2_MYTCO|nr:unnamed protein product [Mytilus coruscus]
MGVLESIKTIPVEMNTYVKQLFPANSSVLSKTYPAICFENVILKHNKTIDLDGFDAYGGVFVSDEIVVIGGTEKSVGKMKAINILNEKIVDEHTFSTTVKRLAFDFESESLFVSCYGSKLYRLKFVNVFEFKMNMKDDDDYNGGICVSDGVLYVIVDKTVKKFSLENVQDSLDMCFETYTSCIKLNGLEVGSKNNRLLYTSGTNEVVCSSWDGREIFKYKDEYMKETTSLSVHSEGIIFVGDEYGSIHLISKDGEQRLSVLNSCDKLKIVRDLCLDKSCLRLAVFGRGYTELYDVCAGSG